MSTYVSMFIFQNSPNLFNKAALMDAAFLEINRLEEEYWDCFIFHDVDIITLHPLNFYTCTFTPVHIGAYIDKYGYR